ncbi:MAG: GNAT family N-acetyltransferase [Verrucomicrobia bacterium]|nr:GNAT family N-acetyltransferase [Verrucomicrobiota bacterium]MBV8278517.1 GNAT family N-acetyltransferase [Verrucomicrobiota bacterium]
MSLDAAFSSFPVLSTHRFHLRQIQPSDAESFFQIKSDPEVTSSYGREPHRSLQDTQAWLQLVQDNYTHHQGIMWAITFKTSDFPIGSCTYWHLDPESHCAEIGYELNRTAWGQGIVSEVLPTVISYGFTELELNRIEAIPFAKNSRSTNVLVKLGFTHEGTLRQRDLFRGSYEDLMYFGLLKQEWTVR